jgi:hypothetical protein
VHHWPDVLPGGDAAIFTLFGGGQASGASAAHIGLVDLASGEWRILIENGAFARYSPSGHIVFARDDQLVAVEFDAEERRVEGEEMRIVGGVLTSTAQAVQAAASFALAERDLVYVAGPPLTAASSPARVGRDGSVSWLENRHAAAGASAETPVLSPSGDRLVAEVVFPPQDRRRETRVELLAADGTFLAPLATHLPPDIDVSGIAWISDDEIAYAHRRPGVWELTVESVTGSHPSRTVWRSDGRATSLDAVSPDGRFLLISKRRGNNSDLLLLDLHADSPPSPFRETPDNERLASFSPDGSLVAYRRNNVASGDPPQVFVGRFDEAGGDIRVSDANGHSPVWDPTDNRVYYLERNDWQTRVFAVTIVDDGRLRAVERELVLELPYRVDNRFAVLGDDEFLMSLQVYNREFLIDRITLIRNWPAMLAASRE